MPDTNPYDYDPYRLGPLKPAIARVRANGKVGSGFLVDGAKVRTCSHVVKDLPVGTPVQCTFGDSQKLVDFRITSNDAATDVAYLDPDDPTALATIATPRIADSARKFVNWWSWGFPALASGVGVPVFGYLADPDATRDGRKCFQLFGANLLGDDAQLGGYSGSPVLVESEIVAMIERAFGGAGDGQRARFGLIFALPMGGPSSGADGKNRPPAPSGTFLTDDEPTAEEMEQLRLFSELHCASSAASVMRVLSEWKKTAPMPPNVPLIAAERIIGMGVPRIALKVLDGQEESVRKAQLGALSLSLLGKHDKAQSLIRGIEVITPESGGISAGILKRRYIETKNQAWLLGAFDQYDLAFRRSRDPYPGINAAATALWLGRKDFSRATALEVSSLVAAKPEPTRDQWDWATLGEASLLNEDIDQALACYGKAVSLAPAHAREISVMRKQARISLKLLKQPPNLLDPVLFVGGVACFTGHRVDEAGRKPARFPREKVADVAKRIRAIIEERHIRFGYSSAAGGADLLFIEQLLACGGSPSVYLPFPREHFVETSVGVHWKTRFDAALTAASLANIHVLSESIPDSPEAEAAAYANCNQAIREATLEAGRIYDEEPVLIAVIGASDQRSASSPTGGTAEAVRDWKERLHGSLEVIDPMAP